MTNLGKPGEPLPEGLTDAQKSDARCQPRVAKYYERVGLEIPVNNPYWRQVSVEPDGKVTALHALSHAQEKTKDGVTHADLVQLWVDHATRPDGRRWIVAEAGRRKCMASDVLRSLDCPSAALGLIRRDWAEQDRIARSRDGMTAAPAANTDDANGEAI